MQVHCEVDQSSTYDKEGKDVSFSLLRQYLLVRLPGNTANTGYVSDSDPLYRASQQAYVVVGHPEKGLVGLGRGRGHNHAAAQDDGFQKGKLPPFTQVWTSS